MYWFDSIIQDRKVKWDIQEKQDAVLQHISRYCKDRHIDKSIVDFFVLRNKIDREEAKKLEQVSWRYKSSQYQKYKQVLDTFNHKFDLYLHDTIQSSYPNYCQSLYLFFEKLIQ